MNDCDIYGLSKGNKKLERYYTQSGVSEFGKGKRCVSLIDKDTIQGIVI